MFFGGGGGGFPFGGMGGMGGMGGGGEDSSALYEILGVSQEASQGEIKKAYRKLARDHHPDKGGDPERFKAISKAYDILGDPDKRQKYDAGFGEEGADRGEGPGMGGGGMEDMLSQMFGGGGGGRGARRQTKSDDAHHKLGVTLEDLYNGRTKKIAITQTRFNPGSTQRRCDNCGGRGVTIEMRRIGPGMVQQVQAPCKVCKGTGFIVDPRDVQRKRKVIEIHIEKGMRHGQKIPFRGEADQEPGLEPGDLYIHLQQSDHSVFKRKGANLFMKKKISLVEAVQGVCFRVEHLDKRQLLVKTRPGEMIIPGDQKGISDEGMPVHGSPYTKGGLFIKFDVEFPEPGSLSSAQLELLCSVLPKKPAKPEYSDGEDVDEVEPVPVTQAEIDEAAERMAAAQKASATEEDDEEGGGGRGGVQCAQQ